jgi:Heterokaryon incompatibility protein (HET)
MGDLLEAPQFLGNGPAHPLNDVDSAQVQKYQYDLIPSGEYTRMLILSRGKRNDPLEGNLELFEVDSPLASKSYEALSYVWGPAPSNGYRQITLSTGKGSGSLQLTASLYAALKRLRYTNRERYLWADQICINQEDLAERSQQVQFMNTIYKHANHVLVWLGQDEKGPSGESVAESAFKLIRTLDETFRDEDKRLKFHTEFSTEEALDKQSRDLWVPLDHLTKIPWVSGLLYCS